MLIIVIIYNNSFMLTHKIIAIVKITDRSFKRILYITQYINFFLKHQLY